jgi:hypothetical protein
MNDLISTTERDGYRILRYANGKWVARGNGYTGSIRFLFEGKTRCEFMATVGSGKKGEFSSHFHIPKDKTLAALVDEFRHYIQWRGDEGEIQHCAEEKCCLGCYQRVSASAPVTAIYSAISAGSRSKGDFSPKDEDGNISVNALYLALYTAPENPEFLRGELMKAISLHPKTDFHIEDKSEYSCMKSYDDFLHFAEPLILSWIKQGGSKALKEAVNLLEKIETKTRTLEKSEMDFLKAVNEAATKIFEVPTQKEVREIWIRQQAGRNEKQFRDVRDRLAFSWLPVATRGKNAY